MKNLTDCEKEFIKILSKYSIFSVEILYIAFYKLNYSFDKLKIAIYLAPKFNVSLIFMVEEMTGEI